MSIYQSHYFQVIEHLPKFFNVAKLLMFFFLLLVISVALTSNFRSSTGKSDHTGTAVRFSQYSGDHKAMAEQLPPSLIVEEADKTNDSIIQLDNESSSTNASSFSFWNESNFLCLTKFKCTTNFTTGWKDNNSIQISSMDSKNNQSSRIYGKEVLVKSNERYEFITHLKHNEWSTQSHVILEGFNETSNNWYQIEKCPSVTNESLQIGTNINVLLQSNQMLLK